MVKYSFWLLMIAITVFISCTQQIIQPPSSPPTDTAQIINPPRDSAVNPPITISYKKKLPVSIKRQLDTGAAYYYNYYYDLQNRLIAVKLGNIDSLLIHYNVAGKIDYTYYYTPTVITNKNFYYYSGNTITDSSWLLINSSYQLQNGNFYTLNTANQLSTLNIPNALQMQYQYDTSGNIIKIDYKKPSCVGGVCYSSVFNYDSHPSIYSCVNIASWFLLKGYEAGFFIIPAIYNNITSINGAYARTYNIIYDSDGYPISVKNDTGLTNYTIQYIDAK